MRNKVQAQLDALRKQEAYLSEQLIATRGAIQTLEHLLAQDDNAGEAAHDQAAPSQNEEGST